RTDDHAVALEYRGRLADRDAEGPGGRVERSGVEALSCERLERVGHGIDEVPMCAGEPDPYQDVTSRGTVCGAVGDLDQVPAVLGLHRFRERVEGQAERGSVERSDHRSPCEGAEVSTDGRAAVHALATG